MSPTANTAYVALLNTFTGGSENLRECSPRNVPCIEYVGPHKMSPIDMCYPVVTIPERGINYMFMYAEAGWIIGGKRQLRPLTKYLPKMAEYSDDGETLYGAYGPPFVQQYEYVIDTLIGDPDSRQAVITIWRQNPNESKDIPCTVSLQFMLRANLLDLIVYMRSSDAWLGVPYDIFNFSMIAQCVFNDIRQRLPLTRSLKYGVGSLYMVAGSRHLYKHDLDKARGLIEKAKIRSDGETFIDWSSHNIGSREQFAQYLTNCAVLIKSKIKLPHEHSTPPV